MTHFLRKINLIKDLDFNLNISKVDFIKKFRDNVDESNLSYEPFEVFKSSQNEYKGNIYNNNFELKKRRKFFDTNYSFAKVKGELKEENNLLNVEIEINGFRKRMVVFFGFMIFFYILCIGASFFFGEEKDTVPFFILPFLLLHMSIMLGLPYFLIKRSVNRMAYDLERDFHYWVTKI